jgi:Ca2+/Na+ antiporter
MLLSMLTISAIAKELVEVLGVLGDAWNISPAIMGITVLGWGNSIGGE